MPHFTDYEIWIMRNGDPRTWNEARDVSEHTEKDAWMMVNRKT